MLIFAGKMAVKRQDSLEKWQRNTNIRWKNCIRSWIIRWKNVFLQSGNNPTFSC